MARGVYRSGPTRGRWRFDYCISIALLSFILSRMRPTLARACVYCLQARQQERGRKPLSVDLSIELARRLIYPELLKFTRQGFVAQTARPHRVYQSRVRKFLPFMPTCLAARFGGQRGCHRSRVWALNHEFCQISVAYDLFAQMSESSSFTSAEPVFLHPYAE